MTYWGKKAASWVTLTVLAGGMVSALILLLVSKVEEDINKNALSDDQIISKIEEVSSR